jgi:hypothetical protein
MRLLFPHTNKFLQGLHDYQNIYYGNLGVKVRVQKSFIRKNINMRLLCYPIRKLCFWHKHCPLSCLIAFSYCIPYSPGELLSSLRDFKFSKPTRNTCEWLELMSNTRDLLGHFLGRENLYVCYHIVLLSCILTLPKCHSKRLILYTPYPIVTHHSKLHITSNLESVLHSSRHIRSLITFSQSN